MQRYQYQHGDRPLEGYTIQRAAGRGGFGEVYYAVSDSGREVALKAVQLYEQIELRGISQCMNLKSPHLVTIFDVKYNDKGAPFVVMEYVSGPSLEGLLAEAPNGLGPQKAAFFLREIAKGLSYLHECGIVHRDLKPGNIFYENGYVKIGDYGLTKAISASRHSGQTITVGTVHYMAPEIGAGRYNRSIDIYALGVLLYEMLTGDVPFAGASPGEILMKHMSVEPELHGIEEPFANVIRKALAKDPADRYQTVQEMVEDLYGSENIRNSVSQFSPEDLSVVAAHVAAKAAIGDTGARDTGGSGQQGGAARQVSDKAQHFAEQADAFGQKIAGRVDAHTDKILGHKNVRIPGVTDPIAPHQRRTLALVTMAFVSLGAGLLQQPIFPTALIVFVMIGVCAKVILIARQRWFVGLEPESRWVGKIVTCCLAAIAAALAGGILGGLVPGASRLHLSGGGVRGTGFPFLPVPFIGGSLWFSLALPMLLADWWRISSPQRPKRLSLGSAVWLGLLGMISAALFHQGAAVLVAAVLAGTSLVVQAASAFGANVDEVRAAQIDREHRRMRRSQHVGMVSPRVRLLWLLGFFISLSVGLSLLIWSGMERMSNDEFAAVVAGGVDSLILSVFCFIGACRQRFNGWYRYIGKPGLLLICVLTVVTAAICSGSMNLRGDEFFAAVLLMVIPSIAFLIIAFLPARIFDGSGRKIESEEQPRPASPSEAIRAGVSPYKRMWALILAAGGLFGFNGLHRFYVGKIGTGIIWFLTGGLLGIGQLIDVILIIVGQFEDHEDRPLVVWQDESEAEELAEVAGGAGGVGAEPSPVRPGTADPAQGKAEAGEAGAQRQEAVERPAAAPMPRAYSSTALFERFHPFAFLLSGVGSLLAIIAVVIGLAMALHIPHFVAAGWPDPHLADEMKELFGFAEWPGLAMRLGLMVSVVLMLLAAVCMILGRRHLGGRHLLRAVAGLGGFVGAIIGLFKSVGDYSFNPVGERLAAKEIGPAFERMLSVVTDEEAVLCAVVFIASVVILAWPPRREKPRLEPALNQGAV